MDNIFDYLGKKPSISGESFIAPSAVLVGDVRIADDVSVWFGAVLRGDINYISIGKGSNVQDGSILHVTDELPVVIGANVTLGHGVMVHGCTVEDNCLIGMRSIILDGARIGESSVIAAGALVAEGKQIPPRSLVMGVPGRIVRMITDEELSKIHELAKSYRYLAKNYSAR